MLRYLSLGEYKWRKCPICYDSVYAKDLKVVRFWETPSITVGMEVDLVLMARSIVSSKEI